MSDAQGEMSCIAGAVMFAVSTAFYLYLSHSRIRQLGENHEIRQKVGAVKQHFGINLNANRGTTPRNPVDPKVIPQGKKLEDAAISEILLHSIDTLADYAPSKNIANKVWQWYVLFCCCALVFICLLIFCFFDGA